MTAPDNNPFWVWTPEDIAADDAVRLFVDSFTDFPVIEAPSHTFVNGPRGSGKSMMFRMMRPDCACRMTGRQLRELNYLGIYVPIKRTEISQTELAFLDRHPGRYVFNEHLLCLYLASKVFDELSAPSLSYGAIAELDLAACSAWLMKLWPLLKSLEAEPKYDSALSSDGAASIRLAFRCVKAELDKQWAAVEEVVRALPLNSERLDSYRGPLHSYHSFIIPMLSGLQGLSFLPKAPVFLLLDDADNLSRTQTEILNSWIGARNTGVVCIKASTQLRYKTRLTFGGQRIESPHDYHEVDVSILYTARREHYLERLSKIVERRLQSVGLPCDPRSFFPEDISQEQGVAALAEEYIQKHKAGEGMGNRPRDDANRYARPEYITRLGGKRKSTHQYSYSGFEQLAHISSGVIRWFLEPSSSMFGEQISHLKAGGRVECIDPSIQNEKIREFSDQFFANELEKRRQEAQELERDDNKRKETVTDYMRLECLVSAMGRTFANILRDTKRSERRVFSIALSDRVDDEVQRVLDLGVQEGYLYRASIGTKSGHGRTARYVLSRRLAPYFSLDPTSFSGYLFVTGANLRQAMLSPKALLRDADISDDDIQMELPMSS